MQGLAGAACQPCAAQPFSRSRKITPGTISMALTPQDVQRIAQLARLELSASASLAMQEQLNSFFHIVDQMQAVDTRGVEPLYTPLSAVSTVALRLRDDVVTETDQRAANQRSAPAVEDGLYLVPQVIE
jgi:aspartyl-tRNA(Asn)/glutamyl-tRNA(Gln) amidotransferase subunit C